MKYALIGLTLLAGCARVHIDCPYNSIQHVIIGGNNAGTVAMAAIISLGSKAAFAMNPKAEATAPTSTGPTTSIDYTTVPIFGTEVLECGKGPLPNNP